MAVSGRRMNIDKDTSVPANASASQLRQISPSSGTPCNLCYNYQSSANRYRICLSAGNPADAEMLNCCLCAIKKRIQKNNRCFQALQLPCKVTAGLTMQRSQTILTSPMRE